MAGHSKWAQIKHKKAASDAKRAQLFSKLVREITVAVKSAGATPDSNPRLRSAMERARGAGLPKENIERAIFRATKGIEDSSWQEFLYEATAPGGVMLLIEGITDNKNRTLAEIKHLLAAHGAKLAEPGSVSWNFEKIGILEIPFTAQKKSREELELAVLESGARDLREENGLWLVETGFLEHESVRQKLEGQNIIIQESGHDYKPRTTLSPTTLTQKSVETLLGALLENEDVQEVYTNLSEAGG